MRSALFLVIALSALFGLISARAGTADGDWEKITDLDAGPRSRPQSVGDARSASEAHVRQQERLLREFLVEHPRDARVFQAKLRLARALQIRADMTADRRAQTEALRLLEDMDKRVTDPAQRVELDFSRITFSMRTLGSSEADRNALLNKIYAFQRKHPGERRVPFLLAEAARLFPLEPKKMRALLEQARAAVQDDGLREQINDDLLRAELVGQAVSFRSVRSDGKAFDLAEVRGSVVFVLFFATFSPPSLEAVERLAATLTTPPAKGVKVVAVCLDDSPGKVSEAFREGGLDWTILCDGKGWKSPEIRKLGVNALPTLWLLDRQGRLRSLDARTNSRRQLDELLREKP